MNRNWIAPLCGVAFVVFIVALFLLSGEGQDPGDKTAQEIINHYKDKDTQEGIAVALVALAALVLLFFAGWIRQVLRAAEGEGGMLSGVAFGALVVLSGGLAVGGTIHLALIDAADNVNPVAVQAINQIDFDFFIPFIVGMAAFQITLAISVLKYGALPKWIAWVAIVGSVLSFAGPIGFAGFVIGLIVVLIVSIVGIVRARGGGAAPATT